MNWILKFMQTYVIQLNFKLGYVTCFEMIIDFCFDFAAKNLFESCTYNQQCSSRNEKSFCQELPSEQTQCSCRKGYSPYKSHDIHATLRYECVIGMYKIFRNFHLKKCKVVPHENPPNVMQAPDMIE